MTYTFIAQYALIPICAIYLFFARNMLAVGIILIAGGAFALFDGATKIVSLFSRIERAIAQRRATAREYAASTFTDLTANVRAACALAEVIPYRPPHISRPATGANIVVKDITRLYNVLVDQKLLSIETLRDLTHENIVSLRVFPLAPYDKLVMTLDTRTAASWTITLPDQQRLASDR